MNIDTQQQQIDDLVTSGVADEVTQAEAENAGAFSEVAVDLADVLGDQEDDGHGNA